MQKLIYIIYPEKTSSLIPLLEIGTQTWQTYQLVSLKIWNKTLSKKNQNYFLFLLRRPPEHARHNMENTDKNCFLKILKVFLQTLIFFKTENVVQFCSAISFSGQIHCSFDYPEKIFQKNQKKLFWLLLQKRFFNLKKRTQIRQPYLKLSLNVWKDCKFETFCTKRSFSAELYLSHFNWKFEDHAERFLAQNPRKFSLEVRKVYYKKKISILFFFAHGFSQTLKVHHWQRCP